MNSNYGRAVTILPTYWSFGVTALHISPLELVRLVTFVVTSFRFWHWHSWVRIIESFSCLMWPPLNLIGVVHVSSSLSFAKKFASHSFVSSDFAKVSLARNSVSSVCSPTIPKPLWFVYSRHGLYVDWSICSFSMW